MTDDCEVLVTEDGDFHFKICLSKETIDDLKGIMATSLENLIIEVVSDSLRDELLYRDFEL